MQAETRIFGWPWRATTRVSFLVIIENKGEESRRIFILGRSTGWMVVRMMVVLFRMVGRKFDELGRPKVLKLSTQKKQHFRWWFPTPFLEHCACLRCKVELIMRMEVRGERNFAVMVEGRREGSWIGKKDPILRWVR